MRTFKAAVVTDFETADAHYVDCVELTCRGCESERGIADASFVPSVEFRRGMTLHCPFCGEQSQVPRRERVADLPKRTPLVNYAFTLDEDAV